ncbi:MAG: PqqD family protein [Bacteroidales bacterium]|nr:PqqD family protein [Bacteroidales bacterium]
MKIKSKYKVRQVADENIVLVQGRNPGDMSTVIALNETSLYLWNNLRDREFEQADVVRLLTERFDVDETTAAKDASEWIQTLRDNSILD